MFLNYYMKRINKSVVVQEQITRIEYAESSNYRQGNSKTKPVSSK